MTSIGRRNTLITLERFTVTQDPYGEEVQAWAEVGKAWAAIFYGRGDERRQAAQEMGEQAATFVIASNAMTRGTLITDRIALGGINWNIKSIAPDTPKPGEIEITATRAA